MSAMSWSDSEAAMLRMVGNLRRPLRYAVSADAMYFASWPAILGTL